nr:MAG TPA: hypothetical protein [Caudoviricetes sp.]
MISCRFDVRFKLISKGKKALINGSEQLLR